MTSLQGISAERLAAAGRSARATDLDGGGRVRCCFHCTVSPLRVEGGAAIGRLAVSTDTTEGKRSELRLRRSEQLMVDTQGTAHLGT